MNRERAQWWVHLSRDDRPGGNCLKMSTATASLPYSALAALLTISYFRLNTIFISLRQSSYSQWSSTTTVGSLMFGFTLLAPSGGIAFRYVALLCPQMQSLFLIKSLFVAHRPHKNDNQWIDILCGQSYVNLIQFLAFTCAETRIGRQICFSTGLSLSSPNNQVFKSTNLEIFRADLDYGYDNIHNQTYDFVTPHPLPPITTPRSLKQETGFDDFKVQMANLSTIYYV